MYHNCHHGYMGMHFYWWIFWILVIIGLGILFYKLFTKDTKSKAIETLKHRFAEGDLSEEEYRAKKKILEND